MNIIKEKRKEKGLTQAQAAELCGMARYYYINIELGRRMPSVKTAKRIGEALGFEWYRIFE